MQYLAICTKVCNGNIQSAAASNYKRRAKVCNIFAPKWAELIAAKDTNGLEDFPVCLKKYQNIDIKKKKYLLTVLYRKETGLETVS